jgi:hypothetical protein
MTTGRKINMEHFEAARIKRLSPAPVGTVA